MSIGSNLIAITDELPPAVKLVAVSKFQSVEAIMEAYRVGQRCFGESRPQELAEKAELLPKDIEWHFIGHLQTNKVKTVVKHASLIHSVDSEHLLREIDRCAESTGKTIECLLEVHIASEESKQGFSPKETREIARRYTEFKHIRIRGVMGMASFTSDKDIVTKEFRMLKSLADSITVPGFDTVSMGMSQDYRIALEEGTTIVRIGTAIFGKRC